ncbi:hypothetical protein PsYK624_063630 [Phanerochaete sordida]|uniref:Uncharacterized protein n=1 Tax=Phanerochaete sordida TaxID=48140 RepID=A0A9P3LD50_9APHY|nr:hypothetical protein PsYK624_063630 [Phanerochaete sordida]
MASPAVYRCLSQQEIALKWGKYDPLISFRRVHTAVMKDEPFLGDLTLTGDERRVFNNLYRYAMERKLAGRQRPSILGDTAPSTPDPLRRMPNIPEKWDQPAPDQLSRVFPHGVDHGGIYSILYTSSCKDGVLHYRPYVHEWPGEPRDMLECINIVCDYLRSDDFATASGPLTRFEMDTLMLLRRVAIHRAHETPGYARMPWRDFVLKWGAFDVPLAMQEVLALYTLSAAIRQALALSAADEKLLHGLSDWFESPDRRDAPILLPCETRTRIAPDEHAGWVEEWLAPDCWTDLYLVQTPGLVAAVQKVVYACTSAVRADGTVVVEYTPSVASAPGEECSYDQVLNNPNVLYDYFRTDLVADQRGALTDDELRLLSTLKRVFTFQAKIQAML